MEVGKIYKTKNGLSVLIESKESFFSEIPWDFTGRDTTFKKYLHYRTNGECREGDEYSIEYINNTKEGEKMKQDMPKDIYSEIDQKGESV